MTDENLPPLPLDAIAATPNIDWLSCEWSIKRHREAPMLDADALREAAHGFAAGYRAAHALKIDCEGCTELVALLREAQNWVMPVSDLYKRIDAAISKHGVSG